MSIADVAYRYKVVFAIIQNTLEVSISYVFQTCETSVFKTNYVS